MDEQRISTGVRYTIHDTLDDVDVAVYDSWSHFDPGARALQMFEVYPRQAQLFAETVVKYERLEVMRKGFDDEAAPDSTPSDSQVERFLATSAQFPVSRDLTARVKSHEGETLSMGHHFIGVDGHPDDDECTFREDGTDATYCGRTEGEHYPESGGSHS